MSKQKQDKTEQNSMGGTKRDGADGFPDETATAATGDDQRGPASGRAPKGIAGGAAPGHAVYMQHEYTGGPASPAKTPKPGAAKRRKRGRQNPPGKRAARIVTEVVEPTLDVQQPLRGPLPDARRERFCQALLTESSATAAALRAGYSAASARNQASRLLTNDDIQRRLAGLLENTQRRSILRRRDVLRNASQRAQGAMVDIGPLLGLPWDQFVEAIKHHPAGKAIRKIKMGVKFDAATKLFSAPFVQEVELFNPRDAERMLADLLGWDAPKRVELGGMEAAQGIMILPAATKPEIGELPAALEAHRER